MRSIIAVTLAAVAFAQVTDNIEDQFENSDALAAAKFDDVTAKADYTVTQAERSGAYDGKDVSDNFQ